MSKIFNTKVVSKLMSKKGIILNDKKYNIVLIPQISKELVELKKVEKVHYIHVLDISGSMYYDLPFLKKDVIKVVNSMVEGDLLSVILLSSHGDCKILIKGTEITQNSKTNIVKLINSLDTRGCTCFSEPMAFTKEIVEDLKAICPDFCVSVFTDGCPVVPWSDKEEIHRTLSTIESFKDDVSTLNTVGYGNYYNADFLKQMASATENGKYTHTNDITNYCDIVNKGYEAMKNSVRTCLPIETNGLILFMSNDIATIYKDSANIRTLSVNNNSVIFLLEENVETITMGQYVINLEEISNIIGDKEYEGLAYMLAKEIFYSGDNFMALDILDDLGDVGLVVKASNAFTKEEKQNVINSLEEASQHSNVRFAQGQQKGTLGSSNSVSLVDLLQKLMKEEALLSVESFKNYSKIGVKTVNKLNNYTSLPTPPVPLSKLTFNSKRANISIMFTHQGIAKFVDEEKAANIGLTALYRNNEVPTVKFRNYAIVKDGETNMNSLVLLVKEDTLKDLYEITTLVGQGNLVLSTASCDKEGYIQIELNLKALPIVSRKYAMDNDFKPVYDAFVKQLEIKAKNKAINFMIKELLGDDKDSFKFFNEEQIEFLKECGLNSRLEYVGIQDYSATKESIVDADTYIAKTLEFKMKGYSSLPDTKKILAALEKGSSFKKFTELAMVEIIEEAKDVLDDCDTKEEKEKALKEIKESLAKEDVEIATYLNMMKLAKIVTGTFWEGLSEGDKSDYVYNDLQIFTSKEEVPFN